MRMFQISKVLKTKNKLIIETCDEHVLIAEIKGMGLKDFSKGYIFTHITARDEKGDMYIITQSFNGLPVSPMIPANLLGL